MTRGDISHDGIVKSIDSQNTIVEIISKSACASCHAASLCTAAESTKKEIKVTTDPSQDVKVGDKVTVTLKQYMGTRAVCIAYAIPLSILLILVVSLSFVGVGEIVSGLAGIAALAVYYCVMYLFRDKIGKDYVFHISRNKQ